MQEEYVEALTEVENKKTQLDGITRQMYSLENELTEVGRNKDSLVRLYDEQDAILDKFSHKDIPLSYVELLCSLSLRSRDLSQSHTPLNTLKSVHSCYFVKSTSGLCSIQPLKMALIDMTGNFVC